MDLKKKYNKKIFILYNIKYIIILLSFYKLNNIISLRVNNLGK